MLLVGCHDEQPYFEEYFLIDEIQNVSEKEVIVSGRALSIKCDKEDFEQIKPIVKKIGCDKWFVFGGIVSVNPSTWSGPNMFYIPIVDDFVSYINMKKERKILEYTSDKYYASSCKKQDGAYNRFSKYPTAVIYWPEKSKLYFVAFSSFGI